MSFEKVDINKNYELAKKMYKTLGIDTNIVIEKLKKIPISIHCWQGDDINGFEVNKQALSGGISVTGAYPGKARSILELQADAEKMMSLIPGKHRFSLHALYADTNGKDITRDSILPEHFDSWIKWAKTMGIGLDFNSSFFSHEKSSDGNTLSHHNREIRNFWIRHGAACRKISEHIGRELNDTCYHNIWIPDGYKDITVDKYAPRKRLEEALDEMMIENINPKFMRDSVEAKLFGISAESYTAGSHEFYMGYAMKNKTMLTLDSGHFHPTEVISQKISAVMIFIDEILLHVSRPVRWDSDHVVILDDELIEIAKEIVRGGFENRIHIGLDFFDASINRIAAWVIGTQNMIKALLIALLEPTDMLRKFEDSNDYTNRLAFLEEIKTYPWQAVWHYYCLTNNVPIASEWMDVVNQYEQDVLSKRK